MPVDDRVFQQIKSGQMNDLEIPPTAIKTFDLPDMHKLYFASIALLPAYESTNAFRILYDAFFDKLLQPLCANVAETAASPEFTVEEGGEVFVDEQQG
jgi:hypothetical protein